MRAHNRSNFRTKRSVLSFTGGPIDMRRESDSNRATTKFAKSYGALVSPERLFFRHLPKSRRIVVGGGRRPPLSIKRKSPSCGRGFFSQCGLRGAVLDAELVLDDCKAGSEFVDMLTIPDFAE